MMDHFEKSQRSVFVGNIPYDTTEEKLKDVFSSVGPVLSFKLVFDRETGKPKGYGFAEYPDVETANSALRNLNGYEIGGRSLRVDNAANSGSNQQHHHRHNEQQQQMDMYPQHMPPPQQQQPQQQQQPPEVRNYGELVEPKEAPETISKAVSSLAPEEMFKLMHQMKRCTENNPEEAREMLLRNPQLAYALLQAQVVMRIVDPEMAITMLHKAPIAQQPQQQQQQQQQHPSMPQPPPPTSLMTVGHSYPQQDLERRDPRNRDPRAGQQPALPQPPPLPPQLAAADPEKAKLIMQVMSLTEEQIAMLPREQRESIVQLKRQMQSLPPQ